MNKEHYERKFKGLEAKLQKKYAEEIAEETEKLNNQFHLEFIRDRFLERVRREALHVWMTEWANELAEITGNLIPPEDYQNLLWELCVGIDIDEGGGFENIFKPVDADDLPF